MCPLSLVCSFWGVRLPLQLQRPPLLALLSSLSVKQRNSWPSSCSCLANSLMFKVSLQLDVIRGVASEHQAHKQAISKQPGLCC